MRFASIASVLAVSVLTACTTSSTTPPAQQSAQERRVTESVRADLRFGLTPQAMRAANAIRGAGYFHAAKRKATLFVSDIDADAIQLFPADKTNPKQSGSITDGIDLPVNDAVGNNGTLYVANNGNGTVTEYPFGQTSPSVTLSGGSLADPNGIAVSKRGTVFVTSGATAGACYVLVFPKGSKTPSKQINGFDLPIGLAIDKGGNLYVADALQNDVWKVPKGSTKAAALNLSGLDDPTGVAIDPANNLWVASDQNNTVLGFHLGDTKPFATITDDVASPYSIAFERTGKLFAGMTREYPGNVEVYKKGATMPFESIDIANPTGLAVFPRPKT
ncbi:MAG TPA: SMP-30/gluconolactonase/LRE family protein [Candidatus Cybelea sp.]|jgi:sugar lactone lactonase YvrE|nr:SMP-30/gluconolactonase/LRE family protein [Candidatus Cybelea sp.]